jgi:glycerophosphoryl diester phosphodiesterase
MFEVIGHRGAGSLLPENTLDGFKLAYELGCPRIELDVHLTSDGMAAVIHNPVLEPTTDGTGLVGNYRMEELKKYDAGGGREIPDLTEVLLAFKDTKLFFQIELKGEGTEDVVPEIVEKFGVADRVRYTSFVHERVRKALSNCISTGGLLMCAWSIDPVGLLEQAGADTLHLNRHNITGKIVEFLHEHNKKIIAWDNIIAESTFQSLIDMNVDGATSDRPDLFFKFLNRLTPVR